ncbi:MAG: hypothetical protein HY044_01165 [Candidatus Woesebacteria bacterium]|nr:MAG: hypothetical protein HY044_01165 [Candidatus Woesebacteria bacterium]
MAEKLPLLMDLGQGLSVIISLPTLVSWTNRSRPKKARRGTFGFNSQTNSLEYFNGSYWFTTAMSKV